MRGLRLSDAGTSAAAGIKALSRLVRGHWLGRHLLVLFIAMSLPFTPTRPAPLDETSSPISLSFPTPPNTPQEHVELVKGRIAVITLNKTDKLNATGLEEVYSLVETLRWIGEQDRIAITVLTGAGRFFSAGADFSDPSRNPGLTLEQHTSKKPQDERELQSFYGGRIALGNGRLARELTFFPKVLVGAMNGPAVGIMAAVVGHCDLLYSYENFWLAVPFSSLGLVSEGLASQTFVRKMGLGRAQECLLEGKRMDAKTLAATGFVTRLLPTPNAQGFDAKDKNATLPILNDVLTHLGAKFMPPVADPHALVRSKQIIQRVTYDNLSREESNQLELRGAEEVFTSGIPLQQVRASAVKGQPSSRPLAHTLPLCIPLSSHSLPNWPAERVTSCKRARMHKRVGIDRVQ